MLDDEQSSDATPSAPNMLLEEFKELGHEYRYRDQLMVQEFGLSMVALGVVAANLWDAENSGVKAIILIAASFFLFVLGSHLSSVNEDRRAAATARNRLRAKLGFQQFHLGVDGSKRPSAPIVKSAPRLMIWFVWSLLAAWTIWAGIVSTMQLPAQTREVLFGWFYPVFERLLG